MIEVNKERVIKEFIELCSIDSETGNEKNIADKLVTILENMGLTVRKEEATAAETNGYNIHVYVPGEMEGEPYLLSAHMDTVVPGNGIKPFVKDDVIYSQDGVILGSDDKSGVEAILEATRVVLENRISHRSYEIVFSVNEEVGMLGAKSVDTSKLKSKKCFVLDSSGDVGKVVYGAPGQIKVRAKVIGKAAHGGLAPEKGISSITVASKGIAKMNLGRIDEETTCNIGEFVSKFPTNIVPDIAELYFEIRSRDVNKLYAQTDHMVKCLQDACDEAGAKLEYTKDVRYIAFLHKLDDEVVKIALQSAERIGCKAYTALGGGGSDAHIYQTKGIECVILGTGMTNAHEKTECITVKNLVDSARWALDLITH